MRTNNKQFGFTLIEMVVSLGLFTIVMFIATSAFLSIVDADRKSRATRIAMDNLNLALEDMSRRIKTGTNYKCGGGSGVGDCNTGNSIFEFDDQSSTVSNPKRIIYKRGIGSGLITNDLTPGGCGSGFSGTQGCVLRSEAGIFTLATSPEIDIQNLKFVVLGSPAWSNTRQPVVVVSVDGILGANSPRNAGRSEFKIQTAITQRAYDY